MMLHSTLANVTEIYGLKYGSVIRISKLEKSILYYSNEKYVMVLFYFTGEGNYYM